MTVQTTTRVKTRSPAKLNLTFEILGRFPNGYHEVRTLLQAISLEDELTFTFTKRGSETTKDERESTGSNKATGSHESTVTNWSTASNESTVPNKAAGSNSSEKGRTAGHVRYRILEPQIESDRLQSLEATNFPLDESNLISKAIRLYQERVPASRNVDVEVTVRKRIPIGAGLAGGSANAAAALAAMNRAFGDSLSKTELISLAARLGADVPFALMGGTSVGTNRGDVLTPVEHSTKLAFVLAKPRHLQISTPWAYRKYDEAIGNRSTTGTTYNATHNCTEFLKEQNTKSLRKKLENHLEAVVLQEHMALQLLREMVEEIGATTCRLTGSGPTLYAALESLNAAETLARSLTEWEKQISSRSQLRSVLPIDFYVAESVTYGAQVIGIE